MAELFNSIWDMFSIIGFSVNDIYVSLKDILIFSILATLFVYFLVQLLGGGE